MEDKKICALCDKYENPCRNDEEFESTKENPENFIIVKSGFDEVEIVHEECLDAYHNR